MKQQDQSHSPTQHWCNISADPLKTLEVLMDDDAIAEAELEAEFPLPPDEMAGPNQGQLLLKNFRHWLQECIPGPTRYLHKTGTSIKAFNRFGFDVPILPEIARDVRASHQDYILEGKILSGQFVATDLIGLDGHNVEDQSYWRRHLQQRLLLRRWEHRHIRPAETAILPRAKRLLFERLSRGGVKGVTFRDIHALHRFGRPAPGEVIHFPLWMEKPEARYPMSSGRATHP